METDNEIQDLHLKITPTRKFKVRGVVRSIRQGAPKIYLEDIAPKGFPILLDLLKLAKERGIEVQVAPTGIDEIILYTTKGSVHRNIIVCEEGHIELFHLDNADRRKSYSRLLTGKQDLPTIIEFLIFKT